MSAIGDILNNKEISFKYKRHYFSLKTRINTKMWSDEDAIYYDLDNNENQVKVKTIASFWTLLAEIPNEDRAVSLISHLKILLLLALRILSLPFPQIILIFRNQEWDLKDRSILRLRLWLSRGLKNTHDMNLPGSVLSGIFTICSIPFIWKEKEKVIFMRPTSLIKKALRSGRKRGFSKKKVHG